MYNKLIDISRYLFLFCISYFLFQNYLILLKNNKLFKINKDKAILKQKFSILLFHTSSFLILSFNSSKNNFDLYTISILIKSLTFMFLANLIINKCFIKSCYIIWNCIFFLMSISLVILFRLNSKLAEKQLNWFIIGFLISLIIPFVLKIFKNLELFKYFYLILGLGLLIYTLIYGNSSGGAKNWITVKNITFQPSELVKILFIFYLASSLCKNNLNLSKLLLPTLSSCIFILCLVLQKDLGGALIFLITYLSIMYISTSKSSIIILGSIFSYLSFIIAYKYFEHIRVRVSIWLNPWEDIANKGYQIAQSLFAIGSFGLLGSGLKRGMPNIIPVVERDFIFSAICEEFGWLFGIFLIMIFILMFSSFVKISLNTNDNFLKLLSSGLTSLMCFQSFLIIAGVTKLIPITGVTLPFISYGGTSIIISFIQIGILQWIYSKNKIK